MKNEKLGKSQICDHLSEMAVPRGEMHAPISDYVRECDSKDWEKKYQAYGDLNRLMGPGGMTMPMGGSDKDSDHPYPY